MSLLALMQRVGSQRLYCVVDALLPPVIVTVSFFAGHSYGAGFHQSGSERRPGLLVTTFAMFIVARAVYRLEQALRSPAAYRSDIARLVRTFFVLLAVAFFVRFAVAQ